VSIDSLISPAFRSTGGDPPEPAAGSAPPPSVPGWPRLGAPQPAEPVAGEDDATATPPSGPPRPPLALVRPVFDDPEFSADPPPGSKPAAPSAEKPPAPSVPPAKKPAARSGAPTPK